MVGKFGLNANPKGAGGVFLRGRGAFPCPAVPRVASPAAVRKRCPEARARPPAPPRAGYIENNHKSSQPVCLQEYPDWVGKSFKSPALLAGWPTPPARGLRRVFHWVVSGLGCSLCVFCFWWVELGLSG